MTYDKKLDALAVVFSSGLHSHTTVPISDAMQWADDNRNASPSQVIWVDGTDSWAKGWYFPAADGYRLASIGAGAYGDHIVISRELPQDTPVIPFYQRP